MSSLATVTEVGARKAGTEETKSKPWHGVDRNELDWFPTISFDKCNGCGLCILTCGNDVFRWVKSEDKPKIANPKKCMVGCTTCARVCPEDALTFPSDPKVFVRSVVTRHKIFPVVREELETRLQKFPSHVVHVSQVGTGPKKEKI
jgi:NAD-dependent dihydropyrimidine dehydrogenase PreA subunit